MNPATPTEVQVVTEMDVYEASVRKVVSSGNLNASPINTSPNSYSWSDVEEPSNLEEPKAEEPKTEEPKVQAQPNLSESVNEKLEQLMNEISNIAHAEDNIKVDVELESDEDMSELVDNDTPDLVSDEGSDMPDLVSDTDSEMPDLVSESEVDDSDSENDELMIAVFKRPSCPRCEAALKVLLAHEEGNSASDDEISEEEHDSDETAESDTSESDDSDSDYVPSESESESPRTVRQLRRWNTSQASQTESVQNKRNACIPPLIQFIFTVLVVVHILKFLLNEPHQRIRCYS